MGHKTGSNGKLRRGIIHYIRLHPGAGVDEVYNYLRDTKEYRRHLHTKLSLSMCMKSMHLKDAL